jgi:hypothetical protein
MGRPARKGLEKTMSVNELEETPSPPASDSSAVIRESIEQKGLWVTHESLLIQLRTQPSLELHGFLDIVRATIVRKFLEQSNEMTAVPRISPLFLTDFDRFNLNVQEGFLISLIDGRSTIQNLLKLSPFDHFTTLLNLARLHHQQAITLPS